MFQLAVTIRACRGSLCYGTVHGQVALTCSKSVSRHSFAMWRDTGLPRRCARILWVATAFGPHLKNLLHSGHVLCSTVNATGAPQRSLIVSTFDLPKSSLRPSHQPSVLALASIVFHLPGRKIMSDTHAGQSSKGLQDWLPVQILLTAVARRSHDTEGDRWSGHASWADRRPSRGSSGQRHIDIA